MAELLGVIGSAVGVAGFALKLAESIKKLNDFCSRVTNAPKSLQRTIREIEVFSTLLTQLADTLGQAPNGNESRGLQGCIDLCRVGVERIAAVIHDLDRKMSDKRRRTSLRYAFSKDDIKEMTYELEQGKSSLLLAHQMYMQERAEDSAKVQQHQLAAILSGQLVITQFTQQVHNVATTTVAHDPRKDNTDAPNKAVSRGLVIRTPFWLRKKVWELSVARAVDAWTWSLRVKLATYRIIDWSSPAYVMCESGDITGLQRLFSVGEASPMDCFQDGWNLFMVAISAGHMDMARFLLAQGAASNLQPGEASTLETSWWIHTLRRNASVVASKLDELRHDLRFLLNVTENDLVDDLTKSVSNRSTLDEYNNNGVIMFGNVPYRTATVRLFLTGSTQEAVAAWHWDGLDSEALYYPKGQAVEGRSFMNLLEATLLQQDAPIKGAHARRRRWAVLAAVYAACWHSDADIGMAPMAQSLITRIVGMGVSPHIEVDYKDASTAMQMFIGRVANTCWTRPDRLQVLDGALRQWVGVLQKAGVDLQEYGEFEKRFKDDLRDIGRWWWDNVGECWLGPYYVLIWGLSFGPDAEHWHFWWEHPGDAYAGEFWDMLEHPERTIPGAWNDG